jgi:hypothetical protein
MRIKQMKTQHHLTEMILTGVLILIGLICALGLAMMYKESNDYDAAILQHTELVNQFPFGRADAVKAMARRLDAEGPVVIDGVGEVDLITETHVYSVDHCKHWRTCLAHALLWAAVLDKEPGVVLYSHHDDVEGKDVGRLKLAAPWVHVISLAQVELEDEK